MKTSPVTSVSVLLLIVLLWHSARLAEDISLSKQGGVYELPVEVNGVIILYFILDTGASEVNIPADVALTLYRTGTIQDFLPGQIYALADGSTLKSSRFMLQSLKIGNHRITNVPASVGAVSSPLLLGQSFLERLGTWGMDSQKQVLIIGVSTQRESPAPRPDIPPSSAEVPQQSSSTYPSQPQVARLEPEHKLRERESVAVPASTVSGESRGVQIWSRKMPAFHMDLKPVSNREFLDFVKADPQWKKSQIANNLHDGDYLKHWEGDEAVKPSELDAPVRYVSFYAASAFCSATGKKIPRLNSFRAAASISSSESLTLSYETSYKAPDFNFVHTEWTDSWWLDTPDYGKRILYQHGTLHSSTQGNLNYAPEKEKSYTGAV